MTAKKPAKKPAAKKAAGKSHPGYGSGFQRTMTSRVVEGKRYYYDRALTQALSHVPSDLIVPLLEVCDRDIRAQHRAWLRAADKAQAWLGTFAQRGVDLYLQGHSFANIGRILEAGGFGSADRIARALSAYIQPSNKKRVRK